MKSNFFNFPYWNKIVLHYLRDHQPDFYQFATQNKSYKIAIQKIVEETLNTFKDAEKAGTAFDVAYSEAVQCFNNKFSYNLYSDIYKKVKKAMLKDKDDKLTNEQIQYKTMELCFNIRENIPLEEITPKQVSYIKIKDFV